MPIPESYRLSTREEQTLPAIATALWEAYHLPDECLGASYGLHGGSPAFTIGTPDWGPISGRAYFTVTFGDGRSANAMPVVLDMKGQSFTIELANPPFQSFDSARFDQALKAVQKELGLVT